MANTTTLPNSSKSISSLQARSKSRFEARKKLIKKLTAASAALQDNDGYAIVGPATMDAYLVYSTLNVVLTFTDGSGSVTFNGDSWGGGAGDFQGVGAGYIGYDPSQLIGMGDVSYTAEFAGLEGGILQIVWSVDGLPIGEFTVIGTGDGAGAFSGSGSFTQS